MSKYYKIVLLIACTAFFSFSCQSNPGQKTKNDQPLAETMADGLHEEIEVPPYLDKLPVSSFGEIWAYLVSGREASLKNTYPLTDIGYFGAEIDTYGRLTSVPDPKKIADFPGRVHLVVVCNSRTLSYFSLEEGSLVRKQLIYDLLEASKKFDGLQIDFELVPAQSRAAFHSFLKELKTGLKNKPFTIALPARRRTLEDDVYDYAAIAPIVDRIFVMAYDEHWSTSAPGPIASMDWCKAVAEYSLRVIGPEKLVMGLPFYGRAWGNTNPSRAYIFSAIERIKKEHNIRNVQRENGIPKFTYEVPVKVTVYYEDDFSLSARMEMYRSLGVKSIGFWSLGQESPTFWYFLRLEEPR